MSKIEARLQELGVHLPTPPAPVASYVPFVIAAGGLVHVSGQISVDASGGIKGKVGGDLELDDGQEAARLCALNLLAQVKAACGDLDRVKRVVKINGFVNVAPDFEQIPSVMNGCSDLMVEVFGEAGRHARSAVGVANLPLGFAVEADGVFEIA
ncbi:MAG: RidA family protein [Caulobacterales bacterium]